MTLPIDVPSLIERADAVFDGLNALSLADRVTALNALREHLALYSPFATEPVDCVQWVLADTVEANDYNPNSVAPPEMELLRVSIMADGYTQPMLASAS